MYHHFNNVTLNPMFFTLFLNELRLMTILYWHYKWNSLVNVLMTASDFIWWMLLLDGGTINPEKIAPLAVGYIIWIYANYMITDANNFIVETSQTGILEQIYLSAVSLSRQLVARFAASFILCTIELCFVTTVLMFYFPTIILPYSIPAFIIFCITIMGIAGFAFMIVGFGLIFKKLQAFTYMVTTLLLFLNGSILPLETTPLWVQWLSKTLPTTQGIAILRSMLFHGQRMSTVIQDGSLLLLLINTIAYIALGLAILYLCERYAQQQGIVGHY